MEASEHERRVVERRVISDSQFGDNTNIYQGNVHFHLTHRPARAEVVRVIPYPPNEDLVYRQDLINKLNKLLPQAPGFYSAALWGLGGSGKTQIALDYAYRRCNDSKCCVFWVHADNEATFTTDYKIIGKKLGVDEGLDGPKLLDAVRSSIEEQSQWVIIFDNADNLKLFGVDCVEGTNESLYQYIPRGSQGTVLWTSRDAHISGTLVGFSRGIKVPPMARDEATILLTTASGDNMKSAVEDAVISQLLEELQRLPLAVSQAGAYIRRTSMTIKEYLDLLMQGSSRWDLLEIKDFDRHRRLGVSNSVLETWKISIERIREESELSYRILHMIAYLDSQDIPHELMVAASQYDVSDEDKAEKAPETTVQQAVTQAVTRLVEFSFLDLRGDGRGDLQSYEMHKLIQEAVRYRLWVQDKITTGQKRPENGEAYYSTMALQIVDGMFPKLKQILWERGDKYMAHAIRVGEWAEVSGKEVETAELLTRVSDFLFHRGRPREREPVNQRVLDLRRKALGEKHPDTIWSLESLATTYGLQGRYKEAEDLQKQELVLRQEVLGETHPDTLRNITNLAATYYRQGRYNEAENLQKKAFNFRLELLGEKDSDTIGTMADLAATYHSQGRGNEAEELQKHALALQREILGETHTETIWSMASLASIYRTQGQYDKAEELQTKTLNLQLEVLGEKHPDTIWSMVSLALIYHTQGQSDKAEKLQKQALYLRREVLGEKHPDTIKSMVSLEQIYDALGQYNKAEELQKQVLSLQQEMLGEKHLDVVRTMGRLAATYSKQGQYIKSKELQEQELVLRQQVLGEKHPSTIWNMGSLASIYSIQGQHQKAEELQKQALGLWLEVFEEKHPDTIKSMVELAATYYALGRYSEAEELQKKALSLQREVLGEEHPETIRSMASLAAIHEKQKPGRRTFWQALHIKPRVFKR